MSPRDAYDHWLMNWSDIQDHLPALNAAARGYVLELGVRDGVSTSALLLGVEQKGGFLWSVDNNLECGRHFDGHKQWRFVHADSCDFDKITDAIELEIPDITLPFLNLVFIDTIHTKEKTLQELRLWGRWVIPEGLIMLHDAITFNGVMEAMKDYCGERDYNFDVMPGSNGLGIINIPS